MSFHEELNQKLNVFFNRDWFVELSEQEEEKMEELRGRSCERFWLGYGFHAAFKYLKRKLPDTRVCNEFRTSVLGILVVELPD